jgi:hypothetical protein
VPMPRRDESHEPESDSVCRRSSITPIMPCGSGRSEAGPPALGAPKRPAEALDRPPDSGQHEQPERERADQEEPFHGRQLTASRATCHRPPSGSRVILPADGGNRRQSRRAAAAALPNRPRCRRPRTRRSAGRGRRRGRPRAGSRLRASAREHARDRGSAASPSLCRPGSAVPRQACRRRSGRGRRPPGEPW